jgi:hypothetical protein
MSANYDDPAILSAVLESCAPLRRPEGILSFLEPPGGCFETVGDPRAALLALTNRFPRSRLLECSVIDVGLDGQDRPTPPLVNPVEAIIALRRKPADPPFVLLTARGPLPPRSTAVELVLEDEWTTRRLQDHDFLYATPHIREAIQLRALEWPVTLTWGLTRARASQLVALDERLATSKRSHWEDYLHALRSEEFARLVAELAANQGKQTAASVDKRAHADFDQDDQWAD